MVRIIPLTKEIIGKYMGQLIKIDLECMPEKREEYSREVWNEDNFNLNLPGKWGSSLKVGDRH